jgi:hypothetical protein
LRSKKSKKKKSKKQPVVSKEKKKAPVLEKEKSKEPTAEKKARKKAKLKSKPAIVTPVAAITKTKPVVEKPVPIIKKRVARKKQAKADSIPTTRKKPAVRAKAYTTHPPAVVSNKNASKNGNGKSKGNMVTPPAVDKPIPKVPTRSRGSRRGIRLNPNI